MMYILIFLVISYIILNFLDKYHHKRIKEHFIEEKRFANLLLDMTEISKEEIRNNPMMPSTTKTQKSESCDCPVTDFSTLSVDVIQPDKTSSVVFSNKVRMNKAHVNDVFIHGESFLKYDKDDKKFIIG